MSLNSDDDDQYLRSLAPQDQHSDSEGSDSSGDEADDAEADSRRFEQIVSELRAGDLRLDEPDRLETFMHNNQSILSKTTSPENKTLLHYLAEKDISMVSICGTDSLVRRLVQLEADLLAQKDCDDKTPLMRAISLRNHELAEAMVKSHGEVDRILRITYKLGGNCLHEAIRNKSTPKSRSKPAALDDKLVELLVSKASSETLCAQDQHGLSPLHLAVDYSRCDKSQPKIVRSLVRRCPAALDLRDNKQRSPYRYLEETRKVALEKARKKLLKEEKRSEQGSSGSLKNTGSLIHRGGKGNTRERPHDKFGDSTAVLQPLRDLAIQVEAPPTGKYGADSAISKVTPRTLISPSNGLVEPSANIKVSRQGQRTRLSKLRPDEASVSDIKNFLKLHYMRTKKHGEVITFLYGNRNVREINFDLSEPAPVVRIDDFEDLQFEDILQYVDVARLKIEGKTFSSNQSSTASAKDSTGRTDLEELFGWLKGQKRVCRVLSVTVDDLNEPAHSDEAIETCLKGLGIEKWDWRKKDICSEVIRTVAPEARVVHLHWGGNNAILRSWSSADGLRKLPKLESIHIALEQGLETSARMRANFDTFKKRIQGHNSQISVFETKRPRGGVTNVHVDDRGRDRRGEHQWLRVMEKFSLFLLNAQRNAKGFHMKHEIRVALIDDGVDIGDPRIFSRVAGGYSYDERDGDGDGADRVHPFYRSSGGHGTAMASLICKICPGVRLWVFRLRERIVDGNRQLTAKSAAEAVRRAIDNNVDVISMSWTIEKTESNKRDVAELERAIEDAAKSDILMFCSTSDQGLRRDNSYPYKCPTKRIFRIGAAKATGAADDYVGDPNAVDFLFPGHKVVEERSGNSDDRRKRLLPRDLTGSSAATALASGLAALILYCVQIGCVLKAGDKSEEADYTNFEALKNHERMKTALERIGTSKESNNKFIEVWNRFEKIIKKAEAEPQHHPIEFIEELADDLMRTD